MITSVKQAKALAEKFNALETDIKRLAFIKENNDSLKVVLDNDWTGVQFHLIAVDDTEQEDAIANIQLNDFDEYFGWADGVFELFKFAGIYAESV